jgi:heme A synthase
VFCDLSLGSRIVLSLFDMSDVNSQISNLPLAPFVKGGLWPHRLAVVLGCATFPLLFIGGLVTSKGAGLAVPDWPTTFGYNMFLYPWSEMVGNILYEHSHRLVASCVGLLTIALAVALWFGERRTWLRWLGVTALLVVIAQGILGGLRVVLRQDTLAVLHACLAQAFFALTVGLALFTSREWAGETLKRRSRIAGDFVGWERSPPRSFIFRLFLAPFYGTLAKDSILICSSPG